MIKIIKGRGAGKTTMLVKMASQQWLTIICMNEQIKKHIKNIAKENNLKIPEPVRIDQAEQGICFMGKRETNGFVIDNADWFIEEKISNIRSGAKGVVALSFDKEWLGCDKDISNYVKKHVRKIEKEVPLDDASFTKEDIELIEYSTMINAEELERVFQDTNSYGKFVRQSQWLPRRLRRAKPTLWQRLKMAYLVFSGKADALVWPENNNKYM